MTSLDSGNGIVLNCNVRRDISDGIPPINIGRFGLFNRGMSDLSDRSALWYVAGKIESENPGDNRIFVNAEHENIFEVENFGSKTSVILNHVNSNHI